MASRPAKNHDVTSQSATPTPLAVGALRTPKHGRGKLRNGGTNKGGTGRPLKSFSTFMRSLRENPDVQAAIERAAQDETSRGFQPVLRVMADYDTEKPGQQMDVRFPDLPNAQRVDRLATILNGAKQRAKATNGTNGTNGSHG